MPKVSFTKMVASGNDFVVMKRSQNPTIKSLRILARIICARKLGVGADGLLLLEKSKIANVKMRIFNPDGSEAQMCGNGARCVALWAKSKIKNQKSILRLHSGLMVSKVEPSKILKIETKAGIIDSEVKNGNVKIELTNPLNIKLDFPIKVNKRNLKANFMDIGVPHAVIFVEGLEEMHVNEIGRAIRNHKKFSPRGANVDFVEVLGKDLIGIRTYERGVEDETLACGTGAVASALIFSLKTDTGNKINVRTKSQEILKVYFDRIDNKFTDVWLEGKAKIVYKGEYYVK